MIILSLSSIRGYRKRTPSKPSTGVPDCPGIVLATRVPAGWAGKVPIEGKTLQNATERLWKHGTHASLPPFVGSSWLSQFRLLLADLVDWGSKPPGIVSQFQPGKVT